MSKRASSKDTGARSTKAKYGGIRNKEQGINT